MLDSRPRGGGFEPRRRHCVVVLEEDIYPSLVLVQPRNTRTCLTERLLMGRKESNQTKSVQGVFGSINNVSVVLFCPKCAVCDKPPRVDRVITKA